MRWRATPRSFSGLAAVALVAGLPAGPVSRWHFGAAGTSSASGILRVADGRRAQLFAVRTDAPVIAVSSPQGTCTPGSSRGPNSFLCVTMHPTASLSFSATTSSALACGARFRFAAAARGKPFAVQPGARSANVCVPQSTLTRPPGTYDLVVLVTPLGPLRYDTGDAAHYVGRMDWRIDVVNAGAVSSPVDRLRIAAPERGRDPRCGAPRHHAISCKVGALRAGAAFSTTVQVTVDAADVRGGQLPGPKALLACHPPKQTRCEDDVALGSAPVAFAPQIRFARGTLSVPGRHAFLLTGSARPARRGRRNRVQLVHVALVRLSSHCTWLTPAGRFARGACSNPQWLIATGTRPFRYRVRGLKPGRYAAYAQAISVAGSRDLSFSSARGNAITVLVR
ncbi:MAG TPA: hypothetical protein VHX88_07985 [Solirubrobacteraceae bacterium]|jgi:hypothetical protein|nr:hypothetical protein [Solirubrobacteraceae bacterium]